MQYFKYVVIGLTLGIFIALIVHVNTLSEFTRSISEISIEQQKDIEKLKTDNRLLKSEILRTQMHYKMFLEYYDEQHMNI